MCKAPTTGVENPVDKTWIEIALNLGLRRSHWATKPMSIGRETLRHT